MRSFGQGQLVFRRIAVLLLWLPVVAGVSHPRAGEPVERDWSWEGVPRVVAFADVHGAFDALRSALLATDVIDEEGHWVAGATHVVSTGDLVDRGPDSRKVLDLLMTLEVEAARAGGSVHVLLGNHELMVLIGDRRYVSREEYEAFAGEESDAERDRAFQRYIGARRTTVNGEGTELDDESRLRAEFERDRPPGFYAFLEAFAPHGKYGRWLLDKNVMIRVNDVVFVHGGLPPIVAELGIPAVNRTVRAELRAALDSQRRLVDGGLIPRDASLHEQQEQLARLLESAAGDDSLSTTLRQDAETLGSLDETLMFAHDGPVWYRGTARHPASREQAVVDAVLERLGARMAFVGHTFTEDRRVVSRFQGRVLLADTGMFAAYYGGRSAVVVIEGDRVEVSYADEGLVEPPRPLVEPEVLTDEQIEAFLTQAQVIEIDEIGTGITKPKRLTLRDGEREMRAVFKTVHRYYGNPASKSALNRIDRTDSYLHEVAAYRLDRMLGLNLVPVTALRTVDGKRGAVQLMIENAVDEETRIREGLQPPDREAFHRQTQLLQLLDVLIYNEDRNRGNVLFTTADWKVHAIDHSRAFRVWAGRPGRLRKWEPTALPPNVVQALRELEEPQLEEQLGELLEKLQIRGIVKRKNKLVRDMTD